MKRRTFISKPSAALAIAAGLPIVMKAVPVDKAPEDRLMIKQDDLVIDQADSRIYLYDGEMFYDTETSERKSLKGHRVTIVSSAPPETEPGDWAFPVMEIS